jgi:elongation factor Ts
VADITAADVKKLRELTDAPMMASKKALVDADGDLDKAADLVRERTGAKMDARAQERTADEGAVFSHTGDGVGALVQLSCETDFVAKGERFQALGDRLAEHVAATDPADLEALLASELDGTPVADVVSEVQAVTGEKLEIAAFARFAGTVSSYLHTPTPGAPAKVGVLLNLDVDGDAEEVDALARGLTMHIAAMKPLVVSEDQVDAAMVAKEQEFARKEALEEGKPEHIVDRIVEGKVKKVYSEIVLLNQPYVLDDKQTVRAAVESVDGVSVADFRRLQVG